MDNGKRTFGILGIIGLIVLLVIAALIFMWSLNRNKNNELPANTTSSVTATPTPVNELEDESFISYKIPDAWTEQRCESYPGIVFLLPPDQTDFNCEAKRTAPIVVAKDVVGIKDCAQLEKQTNVSNHVCRSMSIDGHNTIVKSTTYVNSQEFPDNTTVAAYYITTEKGVVSITYTHLGDNKYQSQFDELATTAKVNN